VRHERVVVGEALEAFALARRDTPHARHSQSPYERIRDELAAGCGQPLLIDRVRGTVSPHTVEGRRYGAGPFYTGVVATLERTWASLCGIVFLDRETRRSTPTQAFRLKKNFSGTLPVGSSTSDNEHTPSSLRDGTRVTVHSHPLSVQHSVGEPVPELDQRPEEGTKVPSSSRRQDTRDVFPDEAARPDAINQAEIDEGEVSAGVCETLSEA
jgi:hypothetical protein